MKTRIKVLEVDGEPTTYMIQTNKARPGAVVFNITLIFMVLLMIGDKHSAVAWLLLGIIFCSVIYFGLFYWKDEKGRYTTEAWAKKEIDNMLALETGKSQTKSVKVKYIKYP